MRRLLRPPVSPGSASSAPWFAPLTRGRRYRRRGRIRSLTARRVESGRTPGVYHAPPDNGGISWPDNRAWPTRWTRLRDDRPRAGPGADRERDPRVGPGGPDQVVDRDADVPAPGAATGRTWTHVRV